jgi:cellulose synthase/poly-beta-1,6-N-acetylglucosamine synthase-like glycosyltransferase
MDGTSNNREAREPVPRVTYLVVAYNQEDFIGESIQAAFAQDYPNLQIVLSDDNSTDRTYALMEEAVAAYRGPHRIVLNRAPGGRGILYHFCHAFRHADGELVVGAAGDDISLPNRVSRLVGAWNGTGAAAIYSAWNRVTVDGKFLSREGIGEQHDRDIDAYFPDREVTVTFGATAAYTAELLRSFPVPDVPIWSEDYFLSAVAMLQGKEILFLDEALVHYRQNPRAVRNFASRAMDFRAYEEREQKVFAGMADLVEQFLALRAAGSIPSKTRFNEAAALSDIAWYRFRSTWPNSSLSHRLATVLRFRSKQRLRWLLPRAIGFEPFLCVKNLVRRVES